MEPPPDPGAGQPPESGLPPRAGERPWTPWASERLLAPSAREPSAQEPPSPADFDEAEPVAGPSTPSRWAVGLVVGVLLGLYVGGNVPAIVGLAAIAAAVAALRAADAALAGAAIGFGLMTLSIVALFLQNTPESQPVGLLLAGAIGTAALIGGVAATAMAATVRQRHPSSRRRGR